MTNRKFKFIDLFSGIGGFHQAMSDLGGECVLASEINKYSIQTYLENYGIDSNIDITKLDEKEIPPHDVLCAGFPCQAFSKAGAQNGFEDTRGTLFFEIERILKHSRPTFIILENVRNLVAHDRGKTWKVIKHSLINLGYILTDEPIIMSPHHLGLPQTRERVFILGIHESMGVKKLNINIPKKHKNHIDFYTSGVLENTEVDKSYNISKYEEYVLEAWDEFMKGIKEWTIGFPIWSDEFKKTYDFSDLPKWKREFIRKNRDLYANNKVFIDKWLEKYDNLETFKPTDRKFEWQCGDNCNTVWDTIIQFRPSGVRVKRPTTFPALVAMVHIPIIGKYRRRLTPREAANLQSFPPNFIINSNKQQAYKQFGNAVNVEVAKYLAKQLFDVERQRDLVEPNIFDFME